MPAPPCLPLLDDSAGRACPVVKVCGFRDGANLAEVASLGVDAVGLNFWPPSKRFVEPHLAAQWVAALRGRAAHVIRVGVFVDPADDEVLGLFRDGVIHAAQLHGDESPGQCHRLETAGVPVIKAVGFRGEEDLDAAGRCSSRVLVDAYAPMAKGGTGRTVDWQAVGAAVAVRPHLRVVLSGGLHPGNVAEAAHLVRPRMIDVASGVEAGQPGIKDLAKVEAFLSTLS